MKKSAPETNHTKAFVTAIGIAFAFLAFVVLYVAFSKGGLDIRSRAGFLNECPGGTRPVVVTVNGVRKVECRILTPTSRITPTAKVTPKPTAKVTPIPTRRILKPTPTPTARLLQKIIPTGSTVQTVKPTTTINTGN